MKETILLTGATGALGSTLLPQLLSKGYQVVCLVRAINRAEAQRRIYAIHGMHPNLTVIRGDITEPRCGISDIDRENWAGKIVKIFHCAACISFEDKTATHAVNVNGMIGILELADMLDAWHFVHVSTAYVAGDAHEFDETDSASALIGRPRNVYEETKQIGEMMVRAWALQHEHRRFTILRPSILIGREDGTTPTFDAYYGYFKPVHRITEALRRRWAIGKGLPAGVRVEGDWINIPLIFQCSPAATLNLVPIDWTAKMMTALLETPLRNQTFHLANPDPPLVRWVIESSLAALRVRGARIVDHRSKARFVDAQEPMLRKLQRQMDAVLDQYEPYTCHETSFGTQAAVQALGGKYRRPRKLTAHYIEQLITYALATNWGIEKKKEAANA